MRNLKILSLRLSIVGLLLAFPVLAVAANASDIPGDSTWYLHVDFEQMRTTEAGKGLYTWMSDEIFEEIKEESGADIGRELSQLTGYSLMDQGPVFLFEGDISQVTKDRLMTFIALEGDLTSSEQSGKSYYRLTDNGEDGRTHSAGDNIEIQFEALEDESWVSMALKNKVLVTSSEGQMKELLKNGGNIGGKQNHGGAMIVLTAEKTLLQAGMNSNAFGDDDDGDDDGDSGWNSNILRNTEQVAFLVAAKSGMLAFEAKLVTTEEKMAESLASVVRGLISLVAFSDDMDAEAISVLQQTEVEADGKNLTISLAIDPDLVIANLSD